ncbi:MAG: hypothetical protein RR387_00960 [Clostridiales bacterium]
MKLAQKRKLFFSAVILLLAALLFIVMFPPFMRWADHSGIWIWGIPIPQFLIWVSAVGQGILVTVLYLVDTKVLNDKSLDKYNENFVNTP